MGSEQKGRLNTHSTKTSEFVSSGHSKERSLMQHVPGGRYPDILWGPKSPGQYKTDRCSDQTVFPHLGSSVGDLMNYAEKTLKKTY